MPDMDDKTRSTDKWDGLMVQISQEAMLLCDCVQKGIMDEGMIMIKVTKDEDGNAVVTVGLAVPDDVSKKIEEERKSKQN